MLTDSTASAAAHAAAERFIEAAVEAFGRAQAQAGAHERHYDIAGRRVRVCLAGSVLAGPLLRALEHLRESPGPAPDLTLLAWDSQSTGVMMPPPVWSFDELDGTGAVRALAGPQRSAYVDRPWGTFHLVDMARRLAIYWVRDRALIPEYELAAPLRTVLYLWLGRHGCALAHAGAVGLSDGAALLAGRGGAGKSNTALSALRSPLYYLADDFCLVQARPALEVFSLYSSGKTFAEDLVRLPFLADKVSNPNRGPADKAIYYLHEHFADRLLRRAPLKAILFPRVTGEAGTRLTPLPGAAAANTLIPSTMPLCPGMPPEGFAALMAVVRRLPAYTLHVGADPASTWQVILDLLAA